MRYVYGLTIAVLLLAGCATNSSSKDDDQVECQAIFDAGSTGTRLWIYYKDGNGWKGQLIEKGPALANLETRTVNHAEVNKVVKLLTDFKKTMDESKCDSISTIKVLATAGMRLAEKHDNTSSDFWQKLYDAVDPIDANDVKATVTTQTITGYEEGIYAWLAALDRRKKADPLDIKFGVAEMGGVSSQVVFPCPKCANTRKIYAGTGNETELFVHSFLRLGTTQIPDSLGFQPTFPAACNWGAGLQPGWKKGHCVSLIEPRLLVSQKSGKKTTYQIKDPDLGKLIPIPDASHVNNWYLAGSFGHMDPKINGDVHNCCEHQREKFRGCFDETRSCFVAIYRPLFLEAVGIKDKDLEKFGKGNARVKRMWKDASWTKGALICEATSCFPKNATRECSWLPKSECLVPPN